MCADFGFGKAEGRIGAGDMTFPTLDPEFHAFRARLADDHSHIRRIDSHVKTTDRARVIESFAPVANGYPEIVGTDGEVDLLISTDVLSEGQNLQDCGYLINYDLHWNPTRMVQRAGRIDRLGSSLVP